MSLRQEILGPGNYSQPGNVLQSRLHAFEEAAGDGGTHIVKTVNRAHLNHIRNGRGGFARHPVVGSLDVDVVLHAVDQGLAGRHIVDLMQAQACEVLVRDRHVHRRVHACEVAQGYDSGREGGGVIAQTPLVPADAALGIAEVREVEDDLGGVGPVSGGEDPAGATYSTH